MPINRTLWVFALLQLNRYRRRRTELMSSGSASLSNATGLDDQTGTTGSSQLSDLTQGTQHAPEHSMDSSRKASEAGSPASSRFSAGFSPMRTPPSADDSGAGSSARVSSGQKPSFATRRISDGVRVHADEDEPSSFVASAGSPVASPAPSAGAGVDESGAGIDDDDGGDGADDGEDDVDASTQVQVSRLRGRSTDAGAGAAGHDPNTNEVEEQTSGHQQPFRGKRSSADSGSGADDDEDEVDMSSSPTHGMLMGGRAAQLRMEAMTPVRVRQGPPSRSATRTSSGGAWCTPGASATAPRTSTAASART